MKIFGNTVAALFIKICGTKKIRPHRSRQRKGIFNVTASKQQTNGRQQLIRALLHERPHTKRVLLNSATANKTNQKK